MYSSSTAVCLPSRTFPRSIKVDINPSKMNATPPQPPKRMSSISVMNDRANKSLTLDSNHRRGISPLYQNSRSELTVS